MFPISTKTPSLICVSFRLLNMMTWHGVVYLTKRNRYTGNLYPLHKIIYLHGDCPSLWLYVKQWMVIQDLLLKMPRFLAKAPILDHDLGMSVPPCEGELQIHSYWLPWCYVWSLTRNFWVSTWCSSSGFVTIVLGAQYPMVSWKSPPARALFML